MTDTLTTPVIRAVPAVSRAAAILQLLARSSAPMGVQAIARTLGLVPSTCLHILRVMAAEHLVSVTPDTKLYALGPGLIALARVALRRDRFSALAQPALDALAARYPVTALAVESLGLRHMVVVGISRSQGAFRLTVDIGSRFPALISATGRCVAAFGRHSWTDIEQGFKALRWDDPPSWNQWRREVAETRRTGFAADEGRYIAGVTILAAPVVTADGTVNTLVLVGLSGQLARAGLAPLGADLRESAASLQALLPPGD